MKKLIACMVVLFCLNGVCRTIFASPVSMNWEWCFTKVTDKNGTVLAEHTGLTTASATDLDFSASPDISGLTFHGTIFVPDPVVLEATNIAFTGYGSNSELFTYSDPGNNQWSTFFDLSVHLDLNAINADIANGNINNNPGYDFAFFSVDRAVSTTSLPDGDYSVSYAFLTAVTDPGTFDQSYDRYSTNNILFTVEQGQSGGVPTVPEPSTMLLFSLGLLGIAGIVRRKAGLSL